MKWMQFVKQYMSDHPQSSLKTAMIHCKEPFAKHKKSMKFKPRLRGKPYIPGKCVPSTKPLKLTKRTRERIKDECGITTIRSTKPKTAFTKKTRK